MLLNINISSIHHEISLRKAVTDRSTYVVSLVKEKRKTKCRKEKILKSPKAS